MVRNTKEALKWIVNILHKHKIQFQISGGFAARAYGSRRKLADIDIGIHAKRLREILPDVKKYAVFKLQRYLDKNWDLPLMTLKYKGQEIDVFGYDKIKIFDFRKKKWISANLNLARVVNKRAYGIKVPIISKEDLIRYKQKIGRKVDIADVKALTRH